MGDRRDEEEASNPRRVYSPEERRASRGGRSTDGRRGVGGGLDDNGRWDVDDEASREGLAIRALAPEGALARLGLAARAAEEVLILDGVRVGDMDVRVGD